MKDHWTKFRVKIPANEVTYLLLSKPVVFNVEI